MGNSFLAVAEELQIKGLTNRDNSTSNNTESSSPGNASRKSVPGGPASARPRSAAQEHPPVKKVRGSSPAPTASIPGIAKPQPIDIDPEEVKEVVSIKDDPEVLSSTSAVNPEEAVEEFGGEDYDESYDGYYEDDGAEMGDGAEGTDGTKELYNFDASLISSEVGSCPICGKQFSN